MWWIFFQRRCSANFWTISLKFEELVYVTPVSQNFFIFFYLLVSEKKMVNFMENVIDFLSSQLAQIIYERFVWNLQSYFMVSRSFGQNFLRFFCVLVAEKKIVRFMKNVMDFLLSSLFCLFLNDLSEILRTSSWYPDLSLRIFSDFSVS